jgi:hypothetical protein
LLKKPEVDKLALAARVPQTQVVMSRSAGAKVAQEARRSKVGSGMQGASCVFSHEQDCRGRSLSRKSHEVKLVLAGREPLARAVISNQAGTEYAQEARCSQICSCRHATSERVSHKLAVSGRLCAGSQIQSS